MRIRVGYPGPEAEAEILDQRVGGRPAADVSPVINADEVLGHDPYRRLCARGTRCQPLRRGLGHGHPGPARRAARAQPPGSAGSGPGRPVAGMAEGRAYVVPQDIDSVAQSVAGHRLILTPEAEVDLKRVEDIIDGVLARVPVPAP